MEQILDRIQVQVTCRNFEDWALNCIICCQLKLTPPPNQPQPSRLRGERSQDLMSSQVPLFRHFHPYPGPRPPIISLMMVFSRNKQFSNIPTSLGTPSCHSFSRKIHQDWFHCFPIFRQSVTKYLWQNDISSKYMQTTLIKQLYSQNRSIATRH